MESSAYLVGSWNLAPIIDITLLFNFKDKKSIEWPNW